MLQRIIVLGLLLSFLQPLFSQNKYVKVNGGVSATTIFYSANGIENRKDPFSYILSGNVNVTSFGVSLPFSFTISNRNSEFRQPFNQFGLSPKYKWVTLHLGYRNIKFDPLVMNGHQVLGIGVELTPGKFRFGAIYGRFKKDINIAHSVNVPEIDSLQQYSRKGYAIKIGVGSKETFVDFIFLNVSDDTLSLENHNPENSISPSANTVIGINTNIKFSKKFLFKLNGAYSVYTTDLYSMPIDIGSISMPSVLPPINISTENYYAIKSSFTYKPIKQFSISLNYRRIEPNYKSMGAYFMQNDAENITLNTSFSIWKNKIRIGGSVGTERNNLNKVRSSTTRRWIGSGNLNFNPTRSFGLTANYANFSLNQQGDAVQIADSVKLYQTSSQFSIIPRYIVFAEKTSHIIMLMYNSSRLNDKNPYTYQFTEFHLSNYMINYNINFLPSGFGFTSNFTYSVVDMAMSKNNNKTIALGLSKNLLKNKLLLRFNQMFTFSNSNNQSQTIIRPVISVSYKPAKHHRIKFHFIYNKNISNQQNYSETTADLSYHFTF